MLLNVHLYLGLFCSWYLLIYGYTSLAFNHPWLLPKREGEETRWKQPVATPDGTVDQEVANAIRDELGMVGWAPYWTVRRDADRHLHFEVVRPGRERKMEFVPAEGVVKVTSARHVFLSYNSEGLMPKGDIQETMGRYGKVELLRRDHPRFRADIDRANRVYKADRVTEYLFCLKKE